ncbi:Scp160p ASCRUDRAFT_29871 [Ascoidea rubescens DSM 1968]|uniref:K Homology domain-containing protein n=1 Tax=Ascoidea rubescens DSM 1968 TaxID=1344418 RepID=A0A1D2VQ54_9ASCO|nr:hypothetical protein ASCRUDRAFT_29871 [Ascoidea rubescens DSM 1968]ODV63752.1 hypothetical protein ASCRUDRAFT_29871 [Ascoidea rubescens DSM 1968]
MSTPAEKLAALHAAAAAAAASPSPSPASTPASAPTPVSPDPVSAVNGAQTPSLLTSVDDSDLSDVDSDLDTANSTETSATQPPSINDENEFPTLGSVPSLSSPKPIWGPKMSSAVSSTSRTTTTTTSSLSWNKSSKSVRMKSSLIQEAFSLDFKYLLYLSNKPELSKILSDIKFESKCNIECTSSQQTKKRTFLITGSPNNVQIARKLIFRKFTKPINDQFFIPSKSRSIVIGSQGKNLKPIIDKYNVKVNIEKNNTNTYPQSDDSNEIDDTFGDQTKVTIEGDIQSVADARREIEAIVNEHTKVLSAKLKVDPLVLPFIQNEISNDPSFDLSDIDITYPHNTTSSSTNPLVKLLGPREKVIKLADQLKDLFNSLLLNIIIEEKKAPKKLHKFINTTEIFNELNVIVEIPSVDDTSNEIIRFIGHPDKINKAIDKAKQSSSNHSISSLNISRAHNNNVLHSRYLTIYFNYIDLFDQISAETDTRLYFPSYKSLIENDNTKEVNIEIVISRDSQSAAQDSFKTAKSLIVSNVNKISPKSTFIIDDVDIFFHEKVLSLVSTLATDLKVSVIPFGLLNKDISSNKILLIAQPLEDDDFGPTDDELKDKFNQISNLLSPLREAGKNIIYETLNVPDDEQDNVKGPNDTTLNSLISSCNGNKIEILFHTPAENEITLHGLKSDVNKISKDINQILQDAKDYKEASSYFTEFQCPLAIISRLIGKGGANVNELSTKYGVKIELNEDKNDKNSKEVLVRITGIKRNAEEAKVEINSLSKKWGDEKTVVINIPQKFHKAIAGPSWVYVNRLQDKYDVKIKFGRNETKKDEVTINGPSKGVKKAQDELKELLDYEIENGLKKEIIVPRKAVARIIGKNGKNLNALKDEFETKSTSKDDKATIQLVGSREAIGEVEKRIKQIAEEIQNYVERELEVDPKYFRLLIGRNGTIRKEIVAKAGGLDEDSVRLLYVPTQNSGSNKISSHGDKKVVDKIIKEVQLIVSNAEKKKTVELEVPKEKQRLLIGQGGSVRKNLENEFNISLFIPKINEKSNIIKVIGLSQDIEKAQVKISSLIKDKFDETIEVPSKYHLLLSERGTIFRKLRNDFGVSVEYGSMVREATKLSDPFAITPEEVFGDGSEDTKWTITKDQETVDSSETEDVVNIPWMISGKDSKKAKKYLEDQLEIIKKCNRTGYFYVKNSSSLGKVVGSGGSKIESIRKKSGSIIFVPRNNDKINNVIYLRGTETQLEKAKNGILAALKK